MFLTIKIMGIFIVTHVYRRLYLADYLDIVAVGLIVRRAGVVERVVGTGVCVKQYAELQAQAAKFDPLELYEARRTIRPEQERQTAQRVQDAYGEKYDLMMMYDSKRHVANLLHEEAEARSIREHLLQKQQRQAQQKQNKKKSRDSWER